ncbi:MAG: hypothetical protein MJA82_00340 [Clostridia bacterium]|nr:hypothetical protein [Clostridia bacterium]
MIEKKSEDSQQFHVYLNKKGEIVDYTDIQFEEKIECNRIIKFCCISTVPDGFILDFNPRNFAICLDTSELSCYLETKTTTCEVTDPCYGTLKCPVDIQAVRLVGCSRLLVNYGHITPISGLGSTKCSICCNTTTCVNQVIGFTCDKTLCEPCFDIFGSAISFSITTDNCGRQAVVVEFFAFVEFIESDC